MQASPAVQDVIHALRQLFEPGRVETTADHPMGSVQHTVRLHHRASGARVTGHESTRQRAIARAYLALVNELLDSMPELDAVVSRSWGIDPPHPILPDAHNYGLAELKLDLIPADGSEPYADMVLVRPGRRVRLRFASPRELSIDEGGPTELGMEIVDAAVHRLEGLTVRVDNYEQGSGALRFVARSVEIVEDCRCGSG